MPITISSNLTATYSGSTVTSATTTDSITENAALIALGTSILGRHVLNMQSVGTSREVIVTGDIVTSQSYWVRLRNLDATNFVSVESYDGVNYTDCGLMYPGEIWGPVRMPLDHTIYLDADTATCIIEVIAAEAGPAA